MIVFTMGLSVSTIHSVHFFSDPIITHQELNKLVDVYKQTIPNHYDMLRNTLGFDQKEGMIRFQHLRDTGYYDRVIFYQFL